MQFRPAVRLREALRNLSLKGLSLVLERVCRLLVIVALAPVLGQAAFGQFVFASTVTALLALGTDLGLGVWTTRALARSRGESALAAGASRQIVRVGLALRGLAAVPYAIAIAAVAVFAEHGEARAAMGLLGISALVNAFIDHFSAILRGHERFADEARLNASRAVLMVVAGLATVTIGRSLVGLCGALAAANVGSAIYGLAALRLSPEPSAPIEHAAFNWAQAQAVLRESLPLWFASLLSMLYFKIDTLFLRSMSGDAELGVYGAAFKVFEGAMILPSILLSVTFPQLARAHADPPQQRRLERQLSALLLGMGLLVAAICLGGAAPLVRLVFGRGFGGAVPSLRVLALGTPLLFVNYGLTHFLIARDLGKIAQWISLLMLALNIALDIVLIARTGAVGAAWATTLTELGLTGCCLGALRLARPPARTPPKAPAAPRTSQTAV